MIEVSHLKIIRALADNGSLTAAANALFVTQSALSHQMRYLENKLETALWQRQGRRLRLTPAGNKLLETSRQVLPAIEQAEATIQAYASGREGILRLGVECHPCYEWLKMLLSDYLAAMPAVDVDIVHQFQFSGLEGLLNHHVDMLVTPDPPAENGLVSTPMFDYEQVLLVADDHPLATHAQVEPGDLKQVQLLTFPVSQSRLDIFSQFLTPAAITPAHKTLQSIEIMVQMVSLGRGVTVLPDWLARTYIRKLSLKAIRLGPDGIHKTLHAVVREPDAGVAYIQRFIEMGRGKSPSRHHPVPGKASRE